MLNEKQARVVAFLDREGVTKRFLADAAGVHRNTLKKARKPGWNPQHETLERLFSAVVRLERAVVK